MGKIKDLSNKRFGRWTVQPLYQIRNQNAYWMCICDCGSFKYVKGSILSFGDSKSCGCLHKEISKKASHARTHGKSTTPEYKTWFAIRRRCSNTKDPKYHLYGGKGIYVCERWLKSFENFYHDMGLRPSKFHSIDRIDNDGPYSPDNCRWATKLEQANNTSQNTPIKYQDKLYTYREASIKFNVPYATLYQRVHKLKWSVDKAIETPVRHLRRSTGV